MKIFVQKLEEGIHEFDKTVPSGTYDFLDNDTFPDPLLIHIFIDRINRLFRFRITIKTRAIFTCDRCLVSFEREFNETIEQLFQVGHSDFDSEDEIEILPENTKEIDISKAIQDTFIMFRPIKLLCKDQCKGLCSNCGADLNKTKCKCTEFEVDPRLEKLKLFMK